MLALLVRLITLCMMSERYGIVGILVPEKKIDRSGKPKDSAINVK